jgi:hypothetical protein
MGYPLDLDEYSDARIHEEMQRRWSCKRAHVCPYCNTRLDSGHPCKLREHNEPVPADVAQEAVLQSIAAEIDSRLPSRRGFVLVVTRFGTPGVDADENALASYVSSLSASEVPKMLRGTAAYIEEREQQRKRNGE